MSATLEAVLDEVRKLRREVRAMRGGVATGAGLLTTEEVAARLRVDAETVRRRQRARGRNHLPAVPGTRPLRFRADVVERYALGKRGRELRTD